MHIAVTKIYFILNYFFIIAEIHDNELTESESDEEEIARKHSLDHDKNQTEPPEPISSSTLGISPSRNTTVEQIRISTIQTPSQTRSSKKVHKSQRSLSKFKRNGIIEYSSSDDEEQNHACGNETPSQFAREGQADAALAAAATNSKGSLKNGGRNYQVQYLFVANYADW